MDHRNANVSLVMQAAELAGITKVQSESLCKELKKLFDQKPLIRCACGDEFQIDSFGGGFLSAMGRCFGCDAEQCAAESGDSE